MITEFLGMLAAGLGIGGVAVWLTMRSRIELAAQAARAAVESERNTLAERLQSRDDQIRGLLATAEKSGTQIQALQAQYMAESERRAAAEEKATRVPALEQDLQGRDAELERLRQESVALKERVAGLETTLAKERRATEEKLALLSEAERKLADAFKALSADALKSNNQSFIDLAKVALEKFHEGAKSDLEKRQQSISELVQPLRTSLEKVDVKIAEIEKVRTSAYATLTEQVRSLATSQVQLQTETANLVKALRAPQVRGRWGEIQLRRVVEMAGMVEHCDFAQQESVTTEEGRLRPDMVVKLPGGKNVVVDSKCPLIGYLDALSATDEAARLTHLQRHARMVKDHITKLGAKSYWDQFEPAPEFVVLFLPGETFFSAALEQDASLIEAGAQEKVILATPTTLIALLRAVAYGWRQERIAQSARQISELGRDLHDRIRVLAEHLGSLGAKLDGAVKSYNDTVGSFESRVLVSARKFKELGAATDKDIEVVETIEKTPRALQSGS